MASATGSERRRHLAGALIAAALLASAGPARADVSALDKATAEALFNHAKGLMKEGRFGDACAKFQESQRIDPGLGTMLYLADCFEKNGQTASAWAQFLEAAAAAKAAVQVDREKKARERAAALEGKLNRLSITLAPGADVTGLEVKRDGALESRATFGTPLPLDPGEHAVEATAPGKKPWSTRVRIDAANLATVSLVVPALENAPAPPPPLKTEPVRAEPPPPPPVARLRSGIDEPGKRAPRLETQPLPVIVRETTNPGRVAGGVLIGVGLATAAASGILGSFALLKSSDSNAHCLPNGACAPAGRDERTTALGLARDTNITLITGSALFATGLVVLLATKSPPSTERQVFQIGPMIGAGTGGLSVRGAL